MDRMDQIGLNRPMCTKWTKFNKVDQMDLIGPSGPHWTEVDRIRPK